MKAHVFDDEKLVTIIALSDNFRAIRVMLLLQRAGEQPALICC